MLSVAIAQSFSDHNAINYVLPVLWNGINTDTDNWRIIHRNSPGGAGSKSAVLGLLCLWKQWTQCDVSVAQ